MLKFISGEYPNIIMVIVVQNCGNQMFNKLADDAYDCFVFFLFVQLVSFEFLGCARRT